MMNICVITSSFPKHRGDSTTGSFILELFKRLGNAGCGIYVVAPHDFGLAESEVVDGVPVERFVYMLPHYLQRLAYRNSIAENVKKSKFVALQVLTYTISCALAALRVVRLNGVDTIVACWTVPQGFIAVFLKAITKRRVIINAFPVELSLAISRYKFLLPLLRITFNKADLIVANSYYTKKLITSLGVPARKIHVSYPGVDTSRYFDVQKDDVREEFGLPNVPILLTVARLVERKGLKYLIRALPRILNTVPKAVLIIVGDGPERCDLEGEVRRLNLDGNVVFLGKVTEDKLIRLYRTSDIFVLPAIVDPDGNTEGLGVVLLEAMSMQKPVVASSVGGIPEAVIHSQTGMLVEPGNIEELAHAITYLLRNEQTSAKMGEKGRQRVKQIFDWNIIASDFLESLTARRSARIDNIVIPEVREAAEMGTVVPVAPNHDRQ
jgi:glycosyltransferase involved in cell wall biosynthesis